MKVRRISAAVALAVVLALGTVAAQEGFEGLVTVGGAGRFPPGLYGATNLVPPNTLVTVRNLDTGRADRIIITDSVGEPGVFLVLSAEAAVSLGVDPSGATRVRLTEVPRSSIVSPDPLAERPFSRDPDINPLAGVSTLLESLPPAYPPAEAPVAPEPQPERDPETAPAPSQRTGIAAGLTQTRVTDVAAVLERPEHTTSPVRRSSVPAPEAVTTVPEPVTEPRPPVESPIDAAIRSVVERLPRKDVHPPPAVAHGEIGLLAATRPTDSPLAVSLPAAVAPAVDRPELAGLAPLRVAPREPEPVLAEARPPAEERPSIPGLARVTPPVTDPRSDLAAARPPGREVPEDSLALVPADPDDSFDPATVAIVAAQPPSAEEPIERQQLPADAILALEPADFRPPLGPQAPEPVPVRPVEPVREPESVVVREPEPEPEPEAVADVASEPTTRIEPDRYYLQIGAYANPRTARVAVDALGATYPMAVVAFDRDERTIYRVLVGPLERDETGTLLLWLRARGYRDTFIRTGSEL